MISFTIFKKLFLKRKRIFFASAPSIMDGLFNEYTQAFSNTSKIGFKRFPFYTKIIDLKSDYYSNFHKSVKYSDRRAKKEGILWSVTDEIDLFVDSYNEFLNDKNLSGHLSVKKLKFFGDSFILIKSYLPDGEILVFHSYLYDHNIKRARGLQSVSNIHNLNITPEKKALVGRANTFHEIQDISYLKEFGCEIYDLGGYAFETEDKSLQGINKYKDSFGGVLVQESNYESFFVYICKKFLKFD
jgi:hypothetical protein